MHILYLDESGGPNSWNAQRNFVLGGVAVHEGQIYSITKDLNEIQEKYFPGISFPIELHVTPIRQGKGPYFKKMSKDAREELITDVFRVIKKQFFPSLIAFATSIDASAVKNPTQVTHDCFEEVCQSFNLYLYHQYRKDDPKKGLLVIDRGREKQYLQIFSEFKSSEEVQKYLANIVDIPYFTACRETRMLQVADFVANAVWRYYEHGIDQEMNLIIRKFYRGPRHHPTSGLTHITSDDTCGCYACTYNTGY
jgi:hypothetical protein